MTLKFYGIGEILQAYRLLKRSKYGVSQNFLKMYYKINIYYRLFFLGRVDSLKQ